MVLRAPGPIGPTPPWSVRPNVGPIGPGALSFTAHQPPVQENSRLLSARAEKNIESRKIRKFFPNSQCHCSRSNVFYPIAETKTPKKKVPGLPPFLVFSEISSVRKSWRNLTGTERKKEKERIKTLYPYGKLSNSSLLIFFRNGKLKAFFRPKHITPRLAKTKRRARHPNRANAPLPMPPMILPPPALRHSKMILLFPMGHLTL